MSPYYLAASLMLVVSMSASFLLPQGVRFAVDSVLGGAPAGALFRWAERLLAGASVRTGLIFCGAFVIASAIVRGVTLFGQRMIIAHASERMVYELRNSLFTHILTLPYRWHLSIKTGDIIQRCTSDVETIRTFTSAQVIEVIRAVGLVTIAYAVLFSMNFTVAAISFVFLPIIFGYSMFFLRRVSHRYLEADEAEGELLSIAQEDLTGVRVVRAFGQERAEAAKFARQNDHYARLWVRIGGMLSTYWGIGDMLIGLQMVAICIAGAWQASRGAMTVGEFIVFVNYNAMIIWPVRGLGRVLSDSSKAFVAAERIREIFDAEPETSLDDIPDDPIEGSVEFRGVTFSYGGADVLRDVSFKIPAGATLGIIGATGSGKSTIAHLICRLYDVPDGSGSVLVGGRDVREYEVRHLRKNVGIVLQEPFLYSRTIAENIASLKEGRSLDEIRDAARIADVDGSIAEFADGYETIVGERGVTLSGGQKQRVAIARTVLSRPPIMIFDDSLSAVDTETDARIRRALAERTRGLTTIVISHRIISVADADVVIVMEDGRIAEMGSPAELLALGGIYRRTADMQSGRDMEA